MSMSMTIGHTCPGCGLDTPVIACEACGDPVTWTREAGSHCAACGLSAATSTCRECGLKTDLDRRDRKVEPVAAQETLPALDEPRAAPASGVPRWRTSAIALSLCLPLLGLAGWVAIDKFQLSPAPQQIAVKLPPTVRSHVLPVPVQPSPHVSSQPVQPSPPPPPPTVYVIDDMPPPAPAPAPRAAAAEPRQGWLGRFLRAGRTQSWEPERHLP